MERHVFGTEYKYNVRWSHISAANAVQLRHADDHDPRRPRRPAARFRNLRESSSRLLRVHWQRFEGIMAGVDRSYNIVDSVPKHGSRHLPPLASHWSSLHQNGTVCGLHAQATKHRDKWLLDRRNWDADEIVASQSLLVGHMFYGRHQRRHCTMQQGDAVSQIRLPTPLWHSSVRHSTRRVPHQISRG
jgi:hypothetical protein